MGVRISDLVALKSLLSWIDNYVIVSVTHPDSLASGFYGNSMGSDRSSTYCQFGPSLDGKIGPAAGTCVDRQSALNEFSPHNSLEQLHGPLPQYDSFISRIFPYH